MGNAELVKKIVDNVEKVIIGKNDEIYNLMKGIIAGGHILIEDVPGVGKTMLVKALAKSLNLTYSRIQFTPDLLPSDITGISIYNPKDMVFVYRKGPIFANLVLADEINRTSPKTQSALLEVMEEKQVTDGNNTYKLQEPFFVIATENPIEYEGTFILPEAQLDRFMIKVKLGYPREDMEQKILSLYRTKSPIDELESVGGNLDIVGLQKATREIKVSEDINKYIISIVNATRNNKYLSLGVSTRGALALLRIAQANALLNDRDYVIPEDVKNNAVMVLSHRVIVSAAGRSNDYNSEKVIKDITQIVNAPRVS